MSVEAGVVAYVLPKVVKAFAGVVVGLFVFLTFKRIYEPIYVRLGEIEGTLLYYNAMQSAQASAVSYGWCEWFSLVNAVLPIDYLMNCFMLFLPTVVVIYTCRFVFRILDTWMSGVLALVK